MNNLNRLSPDDIRQTTRYSTILKLAFGSFTNKKLEKVLSEYETNPDAKLFALLNQAQVIGIIGYKIQENLLVIKQIAIAETSQNQGFGTQLIKQIISQENPLQVQAETDNDAVGFYEKLGFKCSPFVSKYGNKRYVCHMILERD